MFWYCVLDFVVELVEVWVFLLWSFLPRSRGVPSRKLAEAVLSFQWRGGINKALSESINSIATQVLLVSTIMTEVPVFLMPALIKYTTYLFLQFLQGWCWQFSVSLDLIVSISISHGNAWNNQKGYISACSQELDEICHSLKRMNINRRNIESWIWISLSIDIHIYFHHYFIYMSVVEGWLNQKKKLFVKNIRLLLSVEHLFYLLCSVCIK